MRRCAILGASGHGKVVAEVAELNGYENITFFDDQWPTITKLERWNVVGDSTKLLDVAKLYDLVVIAIGNNQIRFSKQKELIDSGANFDVLIHPSAVISKYATIKAGSVVMANAVINSFSQVGACCIVNTNSVIEHDCKIGDAVHVSPSASLAGGVEVGEHTWIGIGSKIKQLVIIGNDVIVGAGSIVISNIPDFQTRVGNPAKKIIKSKK